MKLSSAENRLYRKVPDTVSSCCRKANDNLKWLKQQMHPYFAITMQDEPEAVAALALKLQDLVRDNRLVLADRDKRLIVARPNLPGSLYDTLRSLPEREISYAQFTQSYNPVPGLVHGLEIQRFEFDRKPHHEITTALETVSVPVTIRRGVSAALKENYPEYDLRRLGRELGLLWLNNENYVRLSPPRRIAQILSLYQQSNLQGGIHFDVEQTEDTMHRREYRVMFAAGNPPQVDFLVQTMEVFNRLEIGVKRAYCLTISNGAHPYFLGTFYVRTRDEGIAERGSVLFERLRT
ncbi:MAG TPA: amino acid dehydrogenase, partial [Desulfuromonadales bacterium]|nr:amino acid dehydrogenase [Desulfuromonadales bacterium]